MNGGVERVEFQNIVRNANYSGLDPDDITKIIDGGVASGKLGKPEFALKHTEDALSRRITDSPSSGGSGLSEWQAFKDAEVRMLVYERRYRAELMAKNGGKLPNDWNDTIMDTSTYRSYSDQLEALKKKAKLP